MDRVVPVTVVVTRDGLLITWVGDRVTSVTVVDAGGGSWGPW